MTMLGRGSVSINSGGEKIFPEEVEQALKAHPAVFDCTVVGVPDERWGQRVAAVVQFSDGESCTLEDLGDHARTHIAGYKVPRELHVVDQIVRSPSGKPDYRWAKQLAESGQLAHLGLTHGHAGPAEGPGRPAWVRPPGRSAVPAPPMNTAAPMRSRALATGPSVVPSTPPSTTNEPCATSEASAMPSAHPAVPTPVPPAITTLANNTMVSGFTIVRP